VGGSLPFSVHYSYEEDGSTMNYRIVAGSSLVLALLVGSLMASEKLKSGPQVGDNVPGPFNPLNVTGASAGEKACQV
jgi:hypothetical protein